MIAAIPNQRDPEPARAARELADAHIDLYLDDLHRAAALPLEQRREVPARIAEQIRRMGSRASSELAIHALFRLAETTWRSPQLTERPETVARATTARTAQTEPVDGRDGWGDYSAWREER